MMRSFLSSVLVIVATWLAAHGLFTDREARALLADPAPLQQATMQARLDHLRPLLARLGTGSTLTVDDQNTRRSLVAVAFPYSPAAAEARLALATSWAASAAPLTPPHEVWPRLRDDAFSSVVEPYPQLFPVAAGLLGALGLLLVTFWPRQKLRGLALLFLIVGSGALVPMQLEPVEIGEMVRAFEPAAHLWAWHPWIAIGMLAFAGLILPLRKSNGPGYAAGPQVQVFTRN